MTKILLLTDAIIDTNEEFFLENNIIPIEHGIIVDGEEIFDGFGKVLPPEKIYKMLKAGTMLSTVQGNINQMYAGFRKGAKDGQDMLYICFSSGLSGTYNTACMAAKDVLEECQNIKITVIDSKCAAAGQGILVRKALEKINAGASYEDVISFVEDEKNHIHHYCIIDNLEHLKRGGRVSATSAFVGGLVGIKPMLYVTRDGALVPYSKARGMHNAIKDVITKINDNIVEGEDVYVSHCDNLALAEDVKKAILEQTNVKNVHIAFLGNTIGCHTGPGSFVVFFKGNKRA